ncbi:hypothetical protein E2C01_022175 [Portunus trituberculatus]|uniref:Uncharacterized protein n=1 Tax=Portunus trituberculatus TaxID=210409 RepID=A0A5B7E6B5_PORTR|nr:hypothetical protein [Portunus trituberculatus]
MVELRASKSTTCEGSMELASPVPLSTSGPSLLTTAWCPRAVTVASATSPSLTTWQCSSSFSSSTSELVMGLSTCSAASSRISSTVSPCLCICILPKSTHAAL